GLGDLSQPASSACGESVYSLFDLDGDDRPELVVTDDCKSGSLVGRQHWLSFANQGDSFAATADMWPLPQGHGSFLALNQATCHDNNTHALLDIDGDAEADLVVLSECNDSSNVGKSHWLSFENTSTGFALTPTELALPQNLSLSAVSSSTCPI